MPHRGLRDLAVRSHLPKRTVRLRLTALYCALFFPLGVALIVITAIVMFLSLHASLHLVSHVHGHSKTVVHLSANGAGLTTVTTPHEVHVGSLTLDLH